MNAPLTDKMIWATRGRDWGFRFLLDAGLDDPLPSFESAFENLDDTATASRRDDRCVALRFSDPLGRQDAAGRVIPHEFVLFGDAALGVDSVEDGVDKVWPLVSEKYAQVWEATNPPSV